MKNNPEIQQFISHLRESVAELLKIKPDMVQTVLSNLNAQALLLEESADFSK